MDHEDPTPELVPLEQALPASPPPPLRKVFFNQVELRAGWRFFIFLVLLIALSYSANFVVQHVRKAPPARNQPVDLRPGAVIASDGLHFVLLLGISAIMGKFEKRKLGHYGLPVQPTFHTNVGLGVVWGFTAISVLLLVLRADHNFYYGARELSGWNIARFASLWAMAFLLVGLFEEFLLRGYAQFTLTTGMGFWPAAFLLSLLFAGLHWSNPGETIFGLLQIVLIALFLCFTLRRTGTLWFAVGFHAAWDWGQSFFYGTPDSGMLAKGHLLHSSFAGSKWLTGGSVGPEGSVVIAPLILLLFAFFHRAFPKPAPYPAPEAFKSPKPVPAPQTTAGV